MRRSGIDVCIRFGNSTPFKVMFIFRNSLFRKSFSKLSCVCLLSGKLVNGKHFPVKEIFGLVFRKVFSILAVFVFRKVVSGKPLSKLSYVCLPLEELVNGKHFPIKGKFGRKTLSESCEKIRNVIIC